MKIKGFKLEDIFENVKLKNDDTKSKILKLVDKLQEYNNENGCEENRDNVNIDIHDVKTILEPKGTVAIYTSEQIGSTSAKRAIDSVINELLPINKLNICLILFEISDEYKILKLTKLIDKISNLGDNDTTIIFGTIRNETFRVTQMKLTLLTNTVDFDHITAHKYTANNKQYIEQSKVCGCGYCGAIFPSSEIDRYVGNNIAVCPKCSIDCVVCDAIIDINDKLLKEMNKHWFS